MSTERQPLGWRLWLQWVAATSVGLVLGFLVATILVVQLLSRVVGESLGDDQLTGGPITGAAFAAVLGLVLGLSQWMVLRQHLPRSGWWAPATTAGVALGFLFAVTVSRLWPGPSGVGRETTASEALIFVGGWASVGGAIGIPLGMAQGLVLLQYLSRAGWWVLTSVTACTALAATVATVFFVLGDTHLVSGPLAVAPKLTGAVALLLGPGAITGAVLVWMLRRPRPEKAQP
ncbi:MAG: hypothetical protein EXR55_03215 [Dehalococcoidia bacterium]|nr:hypothetical protein [Dehalococcoidia bacterium]